MYYTKNEDYLAHHGVLGQKWGIRRYQNPDGTLTEAGKKRYDKLITKANKSADVINSKLSKYRKFKESKKKSFWNIEMYDLENAILEKDRYDKLLKKAEKLSNGISDKNLKDVELSMNDYFDMYGFMNRYNRKNIQQLEKWKKELSDSEIENKIKDNIKSNAALENNMRIANQNMIRQQLEQQTQQQLQQQMQQQIQQQIQIDIQNQIQQQIQQQLQMQMMNQMHNM